MLIRSILTPFDKLTTLGLNDTVKSAIDIIEENGFLSLPVTDGDKFVGFLSKQYVYEKFFDSGEKDFDTFLKKPVSEFAYMSLEPVKDSMFVEDAADIFFNNRVRFLPVVNETGKFLGILTQKSLFQVITKIYGLKDAKIVIHSEDFAGNLLKMADVVFKHGANITNIAQTEAQIMNIIETSIRLTGNNLEKLPEKLKAKGITVVEFIPAKND